MSILVASTAAPEITAPLPSLTVPETLPPALAQEFTAASMSAAKETIKTRHFNLILDGGTALRRCDNSIVTEYSSLVAEGNCGVRHGISTDLFSRRGHGSNQGMSFTTANDLPSNYDLYNLVATESHNTSKKAAPNSHFFDTLCKIHLLPAAPLGSETRSPRPSLPSVFRKKNSHTP